MTALPGGLDVEVAFRDHRAAVVAMARRVLRNPDEAEEVAQDVFAGLIAHPERYQPSRGPLRAYLLLAAHSRAVDLARRDASRERTRRAARSHAAAIGPVTHEDALSAALRAERVGAARQVLRTLSRAQREALVLKHWGGFSDAAIARATGTPLGTVKSRLRLGHMALRAAGTR